MLAPGGQEHGEDLDQAAALYPVQQPQVELPAGRRPAHPRTLLGADDDRGRLGPVFEKITERDAESQGQRPQRLDRRVAPSLLQVGQRGFCDVGAVRERGQRHPAGGPEPAQVRRDDVPHVGKSLFRPLTVHANELYQWSNKLVRRARVRMVRTGTGRAEDMTDTAVDPAAIAADAVALAELDGGTGRERERIDWLLRLLHDTPRRRRANDAGNPVLAVRAPPHRLAV